MAGLAGRRRGQVSAAGLEASAPATSKFALNGGLTIGLSMAPDETRQAVGPENFFTTAQQVAETRL